ncbi:hypothetical protein EON83_24410 [bacterium]|nr:MAG: hypothetical protein EON83_24410 [bacterium]
MLVHAPKISALGVFGGICCCAVLLPLVHAAETKSKLQLISESPRQWQRSEFRVEGIPLNGANAYDPEQIALDAIITPPSKTRLTIPLFWYVAYTHSLESNDKGEQWEKIAPDPKKTTGEWRLRWTPREIGPHTLTISVKRGGVSQNLPPLTCAVAPKATSSRGFVSIEPINKRFFRTDDGRPLPLFGMNACWPGRRGTYDYDDWLPAMARNGINYTRLWQANSGFRAELYGNERQNYNQSTLWQLDRVFDSAAQNGINIMLCMGFHGEFQTDLDMWGSHGSWTTHAYQVNNGGPCEKPNDFFTDPTAAKLYQKRLRYLVARYGANPNLFSWQFFNEINNIYGDSKASQRENRDRNRLHPPDVVAWHERMGKYLRSLDSYHHLVTTSFGSAGEQQEMWKLPELDYTNWHWYGTWNGPYNAITQMTEGVGTQLNERYKKPVVIAEFGTDGRGWHPESDAERRGLRQAIWGGIFCGTAGTSMPWWWEDIHRENLYPLWKSLRDFLPADFGTAKWRPLEAFHPPIVPAQLGQITPNSTPFTEKIALTGNWGKGSGEPIILNSPGDSDLAQISGYIHGRSKPELRTPFIIEANLGEGAKLVLHLNSVANDPTLVVAQNGKPIFERKLPNKDGIWERNNEYNEDITVPLQSGRSTIEILNGGEDWFFLDWVRVEGVLPSNNATTTSAIPLEHYLLSDGKNRLLWVVDNRYVWPRHRTQIAIPVEGAKIQLKNWPTGRWNIEWWQTSTGKSLAKTSATAKNNQLDLPIVPFNGDTAARLTPAI